MLKFFKLSPILLFLLGSYLANAQTLTNSLEVSVSNQNIQHPVSLQKGSIDQYILVNKLNNETIKRNIASDRSSKFSITFLKDLKYSKNFKNEWSLICGLMFDIDKRFTYSVQNENLVHSDNSDPSFLYQEFERSTYRFYESFSTIQLQHGIQFTHHLNRKWNLGIRPIIGFGLPYQRKMVVAKELKRIGEKSSEDQTDNWLIYKDYSSAKFDQSSFWTIRPECKLGLDYKPFEGRLVFINIAYFNSAQFYRSNGEWLQDYGNGFSFAIRSEI